jgi:hypothetical protein
VYYNSNGRQSPTPQPAWSLNKPTNFYFCIDLLGVYYQQTGNTPWNVRVVSDIKEALEQLTCHTTHPRTQRESVLFIGTQFSNLYIVSDIKEALKQLTCHTTHSRTQTTKKRREPLFLQEQIKVIIII